MTAAFQNRLKNYDIATANVKLIQNDQGEITDASIGDENNSKPDTFEAIATFTIVSYDADGKFKPTVPWKLRASSGHEKLVKTDESKITESSKPTFVSKSYAVMLDNFFENKPPEFVLMAKPGDRLINLLECGALNASEYTYCNGLYLGGDTPIESVKLNPGENGAILGTLGGEFGDKKHVKFKSFDSSGNNIGNRIFEFDRRNLFQELHIDFHKYVLEEGVALYLWAGQNHESIKAEGGGELKAEVKELKTMSFMTVLSKAMLVN